MPEIMDVIDKNENVLGSATRQEIRQKNLLHKGVAVLVSNSKGEIFVQKRAKDKDIYPGMYDMFCGGAISSGENPDSAAVREVKEELGIESPALKFLFKKRCKSDTNNVLMSVYACTYNGKIKIQKEEIEKGFFLSPAKLNELMKKEKFCPKAPFLFRLYKKFYKK